MARSRSLGHQPGFAELHTTQAVTSLSCAHLNINPCICLLLILPSHEGIVNSLCVVSGHAIQLAGHEIPYATTVQRSSSGTTPRFTVCPIGTAFLEFTDPGLHEPLLCAID